jgi:hypothetical protein
MIARLFRSSSTAVPAIRALMLGALMLGLSCIIPDRDIQVRTTDFNLYPVRFVEGIPLTEDARCDCDADACECPLPDFTQLPAFLDPNAFEFCICMENNYDANRLPGVFLYVEDQDEVDGEPADLLYAAALLDWSPTLGVPAFDYVAYRSYLDPSISLNLAPVGSYENDVIKRPRPYVRSIALTFDDAFDLCNGAGRPLEPGFHTVSFIVTDREWSTRISDEGMKVTNEGVPDIASGATYDIQTYVFQCLAEGDDGCGCMAIE